MPNRFRNDKPHSWRSFFLFRFLRRLRKQYYALRRRKMRAHQEKFRHMTVRSTSPWYRILLLFQKGFHYFRTSVSAVMSFLSPAVFPLLGAALICGCLWFFSNYSVGLAVGVGDEIIGYVENSAQYSKINDQVETRVKQESVAQTGEELYLIEAFPTLRYAIVDRDDFTREQDLYAALYTMASEYTRRTYGLFLDGELVATSKDRSILDAVLEQVLGCRSVKISWK